MSTPAFVKRAGRHPAVQGLAASLAAAHIAAVRRTSRWQTVNDAAARPAWAGEHPIIVAFWHNRLALMPYCWPSERPFHMLISAHPDGQLIARTVRHFGIDAVPGSSRRGGSEAMRLLLRKLKAGESVGITPDGPRGPRMRAQDGALALARLSGVQIVPAAAAVSRRKVLHTWDRLIVPLPFSDGAMVWGEPIAVPRDADEGALANLRERLEQELTRVTTAADALVGAAPIPAADPAPRHAAA